MSEHNTIFQMSRNASASTLNSVQLFSSDYIEPKVSPIDQYIENKTSYLKLIGTHLIDIESQDKRLYPLATTKSNEWQKLSNLLILGFISSVETYCRSIIRKTLIIDEESRRKSYQNTITYGAALHHKQDMLPEALLEGASFSSSKNICDTISSHLGINLRSTLQKNLKLKTAMDNFDVICQLRHCVVHRSGLLGSNNAISLGMDDHRDFLEKPITLDIVAVQNIASISESLVIEINNSLFKELLSRTIKTLQWEGNLNNDEDKFLPYYSLYISKELDSDSYKKSCYDDFCSTHNLNFQKNKK